MVLLGELSTTLAFSEWQSGPEAQTEVDYNETANFGTHAISIEDEKLQVDVRPKRGSFDTSFTGVSDSSHCVWEFGPPPGKEGFNTPNKVRFVSPERDMSKKFYTPRFHGAFVTESSDSEGKQPVWNVEGTFEDVDFEIKIRPDNTIDDNVFRSDIAMGESGCIETELTS